MADGRTHGGTHGIGRGSAGSVSYRPGRSLFAGLVLLLAFAAATFGFLLWYVPTVGLRNIHPALPWLLGVVTLVLSLAIFGGGAVILNAALRGRVPFYAGWLRWLIMRFYLPVMSMAGAVLKIPKIRVEQAFIDLNNQMVRMMARGLKPGRLLILMPHCIQFDNCRIKVTRDVRNCAGCGKCEIGELISLSDEFGVSLFISTGGTVARRKVQEERPDAVIAVACERDLASGLQDAYPLPVLAIVNERPRGYCMETGVAVKDVRQAVIELAGRAP